MRPQQILGWIFLLIFLGFLGWKLTGQLERLDMDGPVVFFVVLLVLLILLGVQRVVSR